MSGDLAWLFSPAWDAVKLTQKVGSQPGAAAGVLGGRLREQRRTGTLVLICSFVVSW